MLHANPYLKPLFNIVVTKYTSTYSEEAPRIVANLDIKGRENLFHIGLLRSVYMSKGNSVLFQSQIGFFPECITQWTVA